MQRLEASCAVRPIYTSLGAKGLNDTGTSISKIHVQFDTLCTDSKGRDIFKKKKWTSFVGSYLPTSYFSHCERFRNGQKTLRSPGASLFALAPTITARPMKMGPIYYLETSVSNYKPRPRNIPEKWRPTPRRKPWNISTTKKSGTCSISCVHPTPPKSHYPRLDHSYNRGQDWLEIMGFFLVSCDWSLAGPQTRLNSTLSNHSISRVSKPHRRGKLADL